MVESYLHKAAKELLYKEVEDKSGFEYKLSNGTPGFSSLTPREDYRGECVLMEFPTKEGYYPDELGCEFKPEKISCVNRQKNFRFNAGNGYCKCSGCQYYNFNESVVHDIAAFWKGNVRWAIEIVNKHEPSWNEIYASMPYDIYFVRAEDALKRIDSTPVFVYKIIRTCYPE